MNRIVYAALFAVSASSPSRAQPVRWPTSVGGNGHYYERVNVSINWTNAKLAAAGRTVQGVPGHLATVTSAAENSFIVDSLGGSLVRDRWFGGVQPAGSPEPGGGWTWVTGEPWAYTNWLAGQPSNTPPLGEEALMFVGAPYTLGTWNDYPGGNLLPGYIVEYPVPVGIVAWYRFEEGSPGGIASGPGSIVDHSGNGHNGTAFGSPVYTGPGLGGTVVALHFDGSNDRVFVPDHPAFELTDSLTLEAYIRIEFLPPGCCGQSQIVFRGDDRVGLDPYWLDMLSDRRVRFAVVNASNVGASVMSGSPLAFGVTHHVAGTLDGTTGQMRLFVNGQLAAAITTAIRPFGSLTGSNPGLGIGNVQNAGPSEYFGGVIDEVRISNTALQANELLPPPCYPNCDGSYTSPLLNVNDFTCFTNAYAAGSIYANCDGSTIAPVLNVNDFTCFMNRYAAGCP